MPRTALTFPKRQTVENLVVNGNFEYVPPFMAATTTINRYIDGTSGGSSNTDSPYGWWIPSSFTASASAQYDTSVYRSGTASLKLSTLNAAGVANAISGNNSTRQTNQKTAISALPNTTYTLTGWVKTNNANTNSVYMDAIEYAGVNTALLSNSTAKLSGTNDWTQLTTTFTTNASTRYLFVVLRNNVVGNISDAWFDDITLVKSPVQTRTAVAVEPLPIVNAGFETAPPFTAATNINGRYIDGTAGGSATDVGYKWKTSSCTNSEVKFDSSQEYTGNYSMKLSTLSTGAIVTVEQIYTDLSFKAKPNTSYIMTLKMKTQFNSGSSSSGAYGILSQRNSAGAITNTNYSVSVLTTTDWTQYSIRMTTYPETVYITFGVAINGSNGAGTLVMDAWFDDIEIKEVIPQRNTPDNLLSNGNFEYTPPFTAATTGNNVWIDGTTAGSGSTRQYGWSTSRSGTIEASFDSSVRYTGTNSLKLSTKATSSYVEARSVLSTTTARQREFATPLTPNTQYTLSGWMKTNVVSGDSEGASFGFYITDGTGAVVSYVSFPVTQIKTTTNWTYYSRTITSPATTAGVIMVCRIYGHTGAGTLIMDAWFDDFTVTTTAPYRNRKSIDNLIVNGDFESVPTFTAATNTANRYIDGTAAGLNATEFPYKWFTPGTFANATAQYDTSVELTGTASMKLSTTTTAGLASALYGNNTSAANIKLTMIPVLPSTSYTVSGYCKTNNVAAAAAHIDIYEYNGAGTLGATNTTNTLTGTNDWTLVTVTFTTASTARYLSLALRNHVAGNVSDAWFDDVTLVKN